MIDTSLPSHRQARALAWSPAGYDGRIHAGTVFGAILPALAILMVTAALLLLV